MYTGHLRPVYTAVYTACVHGLIYKAVFTARVHHRVYGPCTRTVNGPCTRPCLRSVYTPICTDRDRVRAVHMAVYTVVYGPSPWPCTGRVNDRVNRCVQVVYTAVSSALYTGHGHGRIHGRLSTAVYMGRVHIYTACVQAVYKMTDTASTRPRVRLCTRSCTWPVRPCTRPAHGRGHIQYTAEDTAV